MDAMDDPDMEDPKATGVTDEAIVESIGRRLESILAISGSIGTPDQEIHHGEPHNSHYDGSGSCQMPTQLSAYASSLDVREPGTMDADELNKVSIAYSMSTCLLLEKLPTELRIIIYEYVLRRFPAIIVVDLTKEPASNARKERPSYSLLLACRQIYEECGSLPYDVNKVHMFVPVLSLASDCHSRNERMRRASVASRFQGIVDAQVSAKQLRRARLFLGRLPRLSQVRWTELFSSWMSIRDAVLRFSGVCSELELSFEVYLARNVLAQHRFKIGAAQNQSETAELHLSDGSVAELTDAEKERLRRIKATIVKTTVASE